MARLDLRNLHRLERDPRTGLARVVERIPCVVVGHEAQPPVFCSRGKLYAAGGQELTVPPKWFWKEFAKLGEAAQAKTGLTPPPASVPSEEKPAARPPARKGGRPKKRVAPPAPAVEATDGNGDGLRPVAQ